MAEWPGIVAHLADLLPTLPGWGDVESFSGAARDVQGSTFATVGHATDGVTTQRGSYTKTLAADGVRYSETGSVACQLSSSDDTDETLTTVSAAVFDRMDALEDAIRADRTLGVLSAEGTFDLAVDVTSAQVIPGVGQTLAFALNYYTVT